MKNILNSLFIKHNTSFKSLTKLALSQILLKIVYLHPQGVTTNALSARIEEYISVRISQSDIDDALRHLTQEGKINSKRGRHYIKEDFKTTIDKSVADNSALHERVIRKWFAQSATYKTENGPSAVTDWFSKQLIQFFKEYRNEWINDLVSRRHSGKRTHFDFEKILNNSFNDSRINPKDHTWLKTRFIDFLESDELEDNSLLWYYGLSSFSATLLSARNYADEFTIEMFKDSKFILDTNILLILELEGHDLNYSFKPIAEIFQKLNIEPIYFYISRDEYSRALERKRFAILSSITKFDLRIVKESDCGFIRTALRRGCQEKEDFERFFEDLTEIPKLLADLVEIKLMDSGEINDEIQKGSSDDSIKSEIDAVCLKRTKRSKSKNVLSHDAGLYYGAKYLRSTDQKCWILTRDGTIREFANEKIVRDDFPIAIGLDSFIQLMAINSGGIDNKPSDFAPLFAKIIQYSLLPDTNTFKVEDLHFMAQSDIDLMELDTDSLKSIAQNVNKQRFNGYSDEQISLEIQRQVTKFKINKEDESLVIKDENQRIKAKLATIGNNYDSLKDYVIQKETADRIDRLKKKVFFNWIVVIFVPVIIYVLGYLSFKLGNSSSPFLNAIAIPTALNVISELVLLLRLRIKLSVTEHDRNTILNTVRGEILSL